VGDIEYRGGDPAKAEAAYEEAFMLAEGTRHDEVAAHAGAELVFVVGHLQRRFAEGERWALLAGSVLRRMGAGHEIIAAWRANNLAAVYLNQGKVDKALATALQAVALKRKVLGESHFDVALSLGNVAIIHAEMGRFDEAIAENAGVLAILRDTLGPDHPSLAQHLASGGEFLAASERWAEAQELADQALGVWQRELPPDHPYLAAPLTTIGWSWIRRNHRARAIPLLERALAIRAEKDPEPGGLGDVRFALASALVDGDADTRDRAMTLARQARSDYADARKPQRVAAIDAWLRANMPAAIVSRRHRNHNVAAGDLARSGFR
jgi:tetratricopeptide (TPR) repeat protein